MIVTSQVHHCCECGSAHIVRSGRNRNGSQQYQCRDCGASKAKVLRTARSTPRCGDSAHLRDHVQDDHAVAKKTPEPAHRRGNPVRSQGQ